MSLATLPPMRVPTLTEVVEWSDAISVQPPLAPDVDDLPVLSEAVSLEDWLNPPMESVAEADVDVGVDADIDAAPIDEALLTQRVLSDIQQQVDQMFESRLRAAMAPLIERLTHTLAQEARDQLALTLRDMVAEAVSRELMRHGGSPDRIDVVSLHQPES